MGLTLLLMAAGMGSRYGGLKQVEAFGPNGEALLDYAVYDAVRAGFDKITFIIRREIEAEFKEVVIARLAAHVEVDYVFQELTDLPPGTSPITESNRTKPWGTAHAVWTARHSVDQPFAVLNADDYYGPEAYRVLCEHLRKGSGAYAIVGYKLADTLSDHGTVARGILEQDEQQHLQRIVERTQIKRLDNNSIADVQLTGPPVSLAENAEVSMNIMGFTPSAFPQLEAALVEFLRKHAYEAKSELYLPNVVGQLVAAGEATVQVLPTNDEWFGVTYAADAPSVRERLQSLTSAGVYPQQLWG